MVAAIRGVGHGDVTGTNGLLGHGTDGDERNSDEGGDGDDLFHAFFPLFNS